MELFEKHNSNLKKAIKALQERGFYSQFPEQPSDEEYGENSEKEGLEKFKNQVNVNFDELHQAQPKGWVGDEESPYTQKPLNVKYPHFDPEILLERGMASLFSWRKLNVEERAGILMESLDRVKKRFFELAFATMHTTGQGYMMAFQASGPHAADRALEAIAIGYEELQRIPGRTVWNKPSGKYNIKLDKEWKAVPKGISLVIGCSTFPTWNSVPGIYASLVTGNTVIVKPHPGAVLPIAIFVAEIQKVLKENGADPNTCQLAVDTYDSPIALKMVAYPEVKLIDYTGNSEFGSYLESIREKIVFTEKTGVNSVILDSCEDIEKVAQNLAFSISLYSGQMCTAPQNFYIPESGIKTPSGYVSFHDFEKILVEKVTDLVNNPKAGPFVLGAIQNRNVLQRIKEAEGLGRVILKSYSVENHQFKDARTASPTLVEVDSSEFGVYSKEMFGPIAFLIKTKNTEQSVQLSKNLAISHGAISCGAYTTDKNIKDLIMDEMAMAATPVSFNLTGGVYLNQNASFSDFHVTGGNPSGNASFTNQEYIIKRFTWVGFREPAKV